MKPPESLVTQLDVYTEEKFEDEEDLRERARDTLAENREARSQADPALDDILRAAKQQESIYPMLLMALKRYGDLIDRDADS